MEKVFENAQYIWESDSKDVNQYALFEQKFNATDAADIMLRISVDNRYQLWVNGKMFPQAQGYSDFPFYKVYDEIVISGDFLAEGENTINILVHCQNEDSLTYYPGTPGIIFEILQAGQVITYSHVDKTWVYQVTGYKSGEMERVSGQLSFSFSYDATLKRDCGHVPVISLKAENYYERPIPQLKIGPRQEVLVLSQGVFVENLAGWQNGRSMTGEQGEGVSAKPPMGDRMQYAALQYLDWRKMCKAQPRIDGQEKLEISTDQTGEGIYLLLDLKKEQAGYLELDFEVEEETDVLIGFGEHLDDLRVRTSVGGRQFAASYRASKGRNTFMHTIKRMAGRYLQLHFFTKKVTVTYIGIRSVDYPVKRQELNLSMNFLQEKIFEICVETLRRCMHEHYEDCPWREQALYAMDSRNQILCGYEVFGETTLPKACLRLLGMARKEGGLLELCAPSKNTAAIPSFSLMWIVELVEYARYTGDDQFIGEVIPVAEELIQVFTRNMRNGLVLNLKGYWNFYEWKPMLEGRPEREDADAALNAFFALALNSMIELERMLGNEAKAEEMQKLYNDLKKQYQEAFYCAEKNAYRLFTTEEEKDVYPELVQALCVVSGLCPNREIEDSLCERLLTDAFYPRVSLSHQTFAYEALLKNEEKQQNGVNSQRILADIEIKWSNMLFQGATTFWETEVGADDFSKAGSLCHGWSATPVYFYSKLLKK